VCASGSRCVAPPLNGHDQCPRENLTPPHRRDDVTTQRRDPPSRSTRLIATSSLLLPNSRDAMTWTIGDHGFQMTLSAQLPALIAQQIRPWIEQFVAAHGLTLADIQHFPLHPGGPKILQAAGDALGLPEAALEPSRTVLRHHGNMSSATLLFILEHLQEQNARGLALAIGFGPGLMAEALLVEF
jgi:predicted naringenin-chalcone synthase